MYFHIVERCHSCSQPIDAAAERCPACGVALKASSAEIGERPAHLSVADGSGSAAIVKPAKRLESRAGRSIPIVKPSDDSVPAGAGGWMERLEAARHAGFLSSLPEVDAVELESDDAAPTNVGTNGNGNGGNGAFEAKPAHLLIAELEEDERRQKQKRSGSSGGAFGPTDAESLSIAQVEIAKPKAAPEKKKLPTWVWWLGMAVMAIVVGGVALRIGVSEPPPEPARAADPALIAALEKRKKAVAALEEGDNLTLMGRKKADKAIAAYQLALSFEPTLAKAERGLANAYVLKKDVAQAVKHYKRYLELAPDADDADKVRKIIDKNEDDPMRPKKRTPSR